MCPYFLTLFLFKAHFHNAPTVAASSCLPEDLDVINWTSSSSPPWREMSSRVASSSAHCMARKWEHK